MLCLVVASLLPNLKLATRPLLNPATRDSVAPTHKHDAKPTTTKPLPDQPSLLTSHGGSGGSHSHNNNNNGGGGGGDGDGDDQDQPHHSTLDVVRYQNDGETFQAWFDRMLKQYPYRTKSITTGLTYAAADATAQGFEMWTNRDYKFALRKRFARIFGLVLIGCLWVGPVLTGWFNLLDAHVPTFYARTALDQLVQAPFMIACIFSLASAFEGRIMEVPSKLRLKLKPTWISALKVWIPTQLLTQGVVPLPYRVVVVNGVSYFWDTYLSIESHR